MIKAIFNRAMSFRGKGGLKVHVAASSAAQAVPDWIEDTPEFELGQSDDTIEPIGSLKNKSKKAEPTRIVATLPKITQEHVAFLKSEGVKVANVADATTYLINLDEKGQHDFFSDFEADQKLRAEEEAKKKAAATPAS